MKKPFDDIARQYDLLNDLLSLGFHRAWKKRLVKKLLRLSPYPKRVLDLATGTGDVAALFSKSISTDQIYAVDPSSAMLEKGKRRFPEVRNWQVGAAEELSFPESHFSVVTCTFGIRNFDHRKKAFQEINRVLEPGGFLGILEIHPIPSKIVYGPLHWLWRFGVPALGSVFRKKQAYQYLRDTGASFISAEVMIEELAPHFSLKEKESLLGGGLVSLLILEKR